jgi:hypothetical protein
VNDLTAYRARLAIGKCLDNLEQLNWHPNGYKVVFWFLFHGLSLVISNFGSQQLARFDCRIRFWVSVAQKC